MSDFLRAPQGSFSGRPEFQPNSGNQIGHLPQGDFPFTRKPMVHGEKSGPADPPFVRPDYSQPPVSSPAAPVPATPEVPVSDRPKPAAESEPTQTQATDVGRTAIQASAAGQPPPRGMRGDDPLWGPIEGADGTVYKGKVPPDQQPPTTDPAPTQQPASREPAANPTLSPQPEPPEQYPIPPADSEPPADSWFTPVEQPDVRGQQPAQPEPEFTFRPEPEIDMLRRIEALTRIGALVNFRDGAARGHVTFDQEKQAEALAAPPVPPPIPVEEPRTSRTLEIPIDLPAYPPAVGRAKVPDESSPPELPPRPPEPPQAPAEPEQAVRRATPPPEPDWDAVPSVGILERVLSGLRRDDVGTGQEDPTVKRTVKGAEVEVTPEEIAAAGGDRLAALGDKIARQAEAGQQHDLDGEDPEQPGEKPAGNL